MRRRPIIIGFLAIWGIFATAAFRNCGRQVPTDREPVYNASLSSTDPSEVSQAYWLAARRASARSAQSQRPLRDFSKFGAIKSSADAERVWAEFALNYSQAASVSAEAVKELKSLPRDRVDPVVVECVTELAELFALQEILYRQSTEQCGEMAALYRMIHAEGDPFDSNSPKGKEYESRQADLMSRMEQTAMNDGAVEKRRLTELAAKAKTTAAALAEKHGREFPDLLGN